MIAHDTWSISCINFYKIDLPFDNHFPMCTHYAGKKNRLSSQHRWSFQNLIFTWFNMMLRKCHQIRQKEWANTSFNECRWENLEVARGSLLLCMIKPNFILILLDHTLQWAKCELAGCWCWWYASWEGFSTTGVNPERDLWSVTLSWESLLDFYGCTDGLSCLGQ